MADPKNTQGGPPREVHVDPKKKINWLAWILLGLGILSALWAISRHSHTDDVASDSSSVASSAPAESSASDASSASASTPDTSASSASAASAPDASSAMSSPANGSASSQ